MNKTRVRSLSFFIVVFLFLTMIFPVIQLEAKTIVDKKTKKKYELIETREGLLKEFKSNVFDMKESFKIYVSSNVVKNFRKEFKGIWKELEEDQEFNEIWKHKKTYEHQFKDYSKTKAKCWEWNITKLSYDITREEATDLLHNYKNMIHSKKDLAKAFSSNIVSMKKNFTLYITKNTMKNFSEEFNKLVDDLDDADYLNMMRYAKVSSLKPYDLKEFWKLNVQVDYLISPKTGAELKTLSKKVLKSMKEIEKRILLHVERRDRKIILNVDKKAMNFSNQKQYDDLWNKLYKNKDFNAAFVKKKKFENKIKKSNENKYNEWIMEIEY